MENIKAFTADDLKNMKDEDILGNMYGEGGGKKIIFPQEDQATDLPENTTTITRRQSHPRKTPDIQLWQPGPKREKRLVTFL